MSTTPAADGEAMAAAREAGGWAALLFLAADLDRKAAETAAESAAHDTRGDQDASFVAYGASGAWRAAASMARVRAHAGSDKDSGAVPVSPDTGEAQGHSGDLGAPERHPVESQVDFGPAIDAAIAKAETLNISRKSIDSPEMIARLIAAEVLRVATPAIAAAERGRLADRQQVLGEVKAELDDAFQFTERDGSRHGYVTRAWVESLLAHHAASAVAAERRHLGILNPGERDLVRSDLGQLLEALGLGDYARPESPHEVMLQCIAEVGKIRATERERNAAEVDALAAEFAKPDTSVSLLETLAQRATFPAIHEALKGAAGLIRGGLPDLERAEQEPQS